MKVALDSISDNTNWKWGRGRDGMSQFRLVFRVHAIQRMFQRRISKEEVQQVVATGEAIETYPTDKPFPSRLIRARITHKVSAASADTRL